MGAARKPGTKAKARGSRPKAKAAGAAAESAKRPAAKAPSPKKSAKSAPRGVAKKPRSPRTAPAAAPSRVDLARAAEPLGGTMLHAACVLGRPDAVAYLVARGAELESRTAQGDTPLLVCIEHKKPEAMAVLLTAGANPNARDALGRTPLLLIGDRIPSARLAELGPLDEFAATIVDPHAGGHAALLDMALQLIAHGADLSATNAHGNTPLHVFASCGEPEIVRALLAAGAPADAKGAAGATAMYLACRNGHADVAEILSGAGHDS